MQSRRGAREARRVRIVSPGLRCQCGTAPARMPGTVHTHSFTHLLDDNTTNEDSELLLLPSTPYLLGSDPSLTIVSVEAALNRAVLGSDALCRDLCSPHTLAQDLPALAASKTYRRRSRLLPAARRPSCGDTGQAADDALLVSDAAAGHNNNNANEAVITVPLSPVPQKAAAAAQIVSSILDQHIDPARGEGNNEEADKVRDDEAAIETGLDALRERLAQARRRLESHIGRRQHDLRLQSSEDEAVAGAKLATGGNNSIRSNKHALLHNLSSFSSSSDDISRGNAVQGGVWSELLSSSPPTTSTDTYSISSSSSNDSSSGNMAAGHYAHGEDEDNEEWLAGLDEAVWLPAMHTERHKRQSKKSRSGRRAMHFHPTEYAMRLLREEPAACSVTSDTERNTTTTPAAERDSDEDTEEEAVSKDKQASSAKLMRELSRQYAQELHRQLTHDPALRRYLASKQQQQQQYAAGTPYTVGASDELQQLLMCSLSNRAAPVPPTGDGAQKTREVGEAAAESSDKAAAPAAAADALQKANEEKDAAVLRAQEMLVGKLLQSLPPVPPDLQDELGRQRRLLEHLVQLQQREQQRRQREVEEEVRRRVQAPRLDPATALFSEALQGRSAETNARLGLTKVLEPFTMAQQLQRLAADTHRPLPPLLTLTTGAAPPAPLSSPLHPSAHDHMRATHTSQLSQQLQAMQASYEDLLAAEQAKRHAERQAFTELLQRQQAQLLQQHRRALDTLRHELQQAKKAQEEQMQRLAASKDAALERRSEAVQAAHTRTMKHMLQGAVEVMRSYATPPAQAATRAYASRTPRESSTTKDKTTTATLPEDVHKQDEQQTATSPPPSEVVSKTKPRIDAHFRGPVTVQLPDVRDVSQSLSTTHGVREAQLRRLYGSRRSPGQSLRTRKPKPQQQQQPKKVHGTSSSVQQRASAGEVSTNAQSRSRFIAQETRSLSDDTATNDGSSEVSTTIQDITRTVQHSITQRPNASRRASSSHTPHTDAATDAAKARALHQSLTAGRPAVGRTLLLLTYDTSQSRTQTSATAAEADTSTSSPHEGNTRSEGIYFGADETGCTYGRLWGEYSAALREVQTLQHELRAEQAASLVHTHEQGNEASTSVLPGAVRGEEADEQQQQQQQSASSSLLYTHGSSAHERSEQGPHVYRSTAAMQRHMSRLQHSKEEALLRQLRLPGQANQEEPPPAAGEHHTEDEDEGSTSEPLLRSGPELLTVSSTVAAKARELRAARQRLRHIAAVLFREDEHDRASLGILLPSGLQGKEGNSGEAVIQLQRRVREGLAQETIHSVIGAAAEQALMSQLRRVLSEELLQRVLTSHIVQQQQQQQQLQQEDPSLQGDVKRDARRLHEEQGWAEAIEAATRMAATTTGDASHTEIAAVLESGLQELIAHTLQEKQQQKQQQQAQEKDAQPAQAAHTSKEAAKVQRTSVLSVPSTTTATATALTIPTIHVSNTTAEASLTEHEVVHVPADPRAAWLQDRPGEEHLAAGSEPRHSLTSHAAQAHDKKEQSVVIEPVVHNNTNTNNTTGAGGALRTQTRDGAVHILIDVGTLARSNSSGSAWQPLMPSAAHALPPMQSEQPRRLVREETLHDVIVESVEPRPVHTVTNSDVRNETGLAALPIPSLPSAGGATAGVRAEDTHTRSAAAAADEAARQAQRVREMWQRLGNAMEQDEAQQRWLLCEEEMLQRHTLSKLRGRWAATLAVHTPPPPPPVVYMQSEDTVKRVRQEGDEHNAGQTNAQEEATPAALPPVAEAAERYIRDPVTRFVFEWLHEFAPREAAQRARSAAEQSRYFVEQLHQGDAFAVPDTAEQVQANMQESRKAAAVRLQTPPSSPSPSQPRTTHTSSSSSTSSSSAAYSATHASSLTSGGGHVFAQTSEPVSRRVPRYTARVLASASSSPSPAVQPGHLIQYGNERPRRHRPVLHAEAGNYEEQSSTTTTTTTATTSSSGNAYPVISAQHRAGTSRNNNNEVRYAARNGERSSSSVTTRYTTLTTNTTSEEDEEKGRVHYTGRQPSLLVAPSSVTTRTAISASLTTATTTTTSSSSRPRYEEREREGQVLPHNSSSTTTTTSDTHTTRATTTTATTSATTETSEASVQDVERSSAAAAAAARRRRLISPLNAEDIEAETDAESEGGGDAAGQQHAIEESAPRPGWW